MNPKRLRMLSCVLPSLCSKSSFPRAELRELMARKHNGFSPSPSLQPKLHIFLPKLYAKSGLFSLQTDDDKLKTTHLFG